MNWIKKWLRKRELREEITTLKLYGFYNNLAYYTGDDNEKKIRIEIAKDGKEKLLKLYEELYELD